MFKLLATLMKRQIWMVFKEIIILIETSLRWTDRFENIIELLQVSKLIAILVQTLLISKTDRFENITELSQVFKPFSHMHSLSLSLSLSLS